MSSQRTSDYAGTNPIRTQRGSREQTSGVRSLVLGAAAAWLVLACAADASAADTPWLVTRVDVGEPNPAEVEASRELVSLLRARGLDVMGGSSAASEFERRHSRTARTLPADKVVALDSSLRKLADEIASENLERAQVLLAEIDALGPDLRDQLNHEESRARRRFHICMLAAHLYAKAGRQHEALEQVRKCARDFPGLEPEQSPYMPETIRTFFDRAAAELARIPASTVHVHVENGDGSGCRARLNGIDRGPTPITVDAVRTERVRIQIDCGGRAGRIYDVALQPGHNSIRIDLELDRAVRTQPVLGLQYTAPQTAESNRLLHTLQLARAVGAAHVVQVWDGELRRIDVESRRDVSLGPLREPLDDALSALDPAPSWRAVAAPARDAPASTSGSNAVATMGWISAGAAALAGGGVLVAWRVREGAVGDFNTWERPADKMTCSGPFARAQPNDCAGFLKTADDAETAMWVLGFAGISLTSLATVLFLVDAREPSDTAPPGAANACGPGPGELGMSCRLRF